MAVSSIAVPPDPRRDARALVLAGQVGAWPLFTLKQPYGAFEAGTVFRRAYGSAGARYLVNAVACQCPDYAQHGNICKHVRAYVLWEASQQPPAASTESLPSTPSTAPKVRPSYADLFPPCRGCGDLADGRDGYCDTCASEREWAARRAV